MRQKKKRKVNDKGKWLPENRWREAEKKKVEWKRQT